MPKVSDRSGKELKDGRKALLVYLPPQMILDLKLTALHAGTSASVLTEQAIADWLKKQPSRPAA